MQRHGVYATDLAPARNANTSAMTTHPDEKPDAQGIVWRNGRPYGNPDDFGTLQPLPPRKDLISEEILAKLEYLQERGDFEFNLNDEGLIVETKRQGIQVTQRPIKDWDYLHALIKNVEVPISALDQMERPKAGIEAKAEERHRSARETVSALFLQILASENKITELKGKIEAEEQADHQARVDARLAGKPEIKALPNTAALEKSLATEEGVMDALTGRHSQALLVEEKLRLKVIVNRHAAAVSQVDKITERIADMERELQKEKAKLDPAIAAVKPIARGAAFLEQTTRHRVKFLMCKRSIDTPNVPYYQSLEEIAASETCAIDRRALNALIERWRNGITIDTEHDGRVRVTPELIGLFYSAQSGELLGFDIFGTEERFAHGSYGQTYVGTHTDGHVCGRLREFESGMGGAQSEDMPGYFRLVHDRDHNDVLPIENGEI